MKRTILFLCILTVDLSSAMEILVYNKTELPCCICTKSNDFTVLADYHPFSKQIELTKQKEVRLTLYPKSKCLQDSNEFFFIVKDGPLLFKKTKFSCAVRIDNSSGYCIPTLLGKSKKPNVTKLKNKDGFFMRKYMNDRHDTYILEINKE